MKLITEETVKNIIKEGAAVVGNELRLPEDCLLTPAAKAVLVDHRLRLVLSKGEASACDCSNCKAHCDCNESAPVCRTVATPEPTKGRYRLRDGSILDVKPEHLTQLSADLLVAKDDAQIRLRGEVDLLIAEILKAQIALAKLGSLKPVDDLDEVYAFIGQLSRSEVLDQAFKVETVIGLSYQEVRDISHNPKRYFGRGHLFNISWRDGEQTVILNALRAQSRRCELAFYEAFKTENGTVTRPDLMEGFNRLSSIIYILCLRAATGQYGEAL